MPDNKSYKLYEALSAPDKNLYTKSYDEFVNQFSSEEKQRKLYDALSAPERMLYTKSFDEFKNQFFVEPVIEKVPEESFVGKIKNIGSKIADKFAEENVSIEERKAQYEKRTGEKLNVSAKEAMNEGIRGEGFGTGSFKENKAMADQTTALKERFKNDPEYREEFNKKIENVSVLKNTIKEQTVPVVSNIITKYYPELKGYSNEDVDEFVSLMNKPFLQRMFLQNPHSENPYPKNKFINEIFKDKEKAMQLRDELSKNQALMITNTTVNDMQKVLDTYQKSSAENRLGITNLGAGSAAGIGNYFYDYINLLKTLDKNEYIKSIEDRIKQDNGASLTKDESMMINTLIHQSQLMYDLTAQMPTMRKVGEQVGQSAGFMMEFIATNGGWVKGVGNVAKSATLTSRLPQYANLAGRLSESVAQTFVMPSFYKNALQKSSEGERFFGSSTIDALYESTIENFSERLFVGKLGSKTATTTFGKFLEKSASALSGQKGWKGVGLGMGEEYLEEKFADTFQLPYQLYVNDQSDNTKSKKLYKSLADSYKEFFNVDRNIETALSTGVITGIMGSANQAMTGLHRKTMNRYGKEIPAYLKDYIDGLTMNESLTYKEAFGKVNNYINQLAIGGGFGTNKKELDAAYGYASMALSELFSEDVKEQYQKMQEQKIKEKEKENASPVEEPKETEEKANNQFAVYEIVPGEGKAKDENTHGFYIRQKNNSKPVVDTPFKTKEEAQTHIKNVLKGEEVPYEETTLKVKKSQNVFEEYQNANEIQSDEVIYDSMNKQEQEAFDTRKKDIEKQIVTEMHDENALTDDIITSDLANKNEQVTVQRRVLGKTINTPATVIEKSKKGLIVKYNNGEKETITDKSKVKLYKNYSEEITNDLELDTKTERKGKIVYATSGMGKTTLAKQHPEKYTDADILLAETIKENIDEYEIDDKLRTFLKDHSAEEIANFNSVNKKGSKKTFASVIMELFRQEKEKKGIRHDQTTMHKVYNLNAKKMVEASKDKIVLTGSSRYLKDGIVDEVYTKEENPNNKMSESEWKEMKKNETKRFAEVNRRREKEGKPLLKANAVEKDKFIHDVFEEKYISKKETVKKKVTKEKVIEEKKITEGKPVEEKEVVVKKEQAKEPVKKKVIPKEKPKSFSSMTFEEIEERFESNDTPIEEGNPNKESLLNAVSEFAKRKQLEYEEKSKDPRRPKTQGIGGDFLIEKAVWYMIEQSANYTEKGLKGIQDLINRVCNYLRNTGDFNEEELSDLYQKVSEFIKGTDPDITAFRKVYELIDNVHASTEAMGVDSDQKVESHRRSFSRLFSETAKKLKIDKDELEEQFFSLVKSGYFNEMTGIEDYIKRLNKFEKEYPQYKELSLQMKEYYTYDKAISLFNFYRSVTLTPQMALIFGTQGKITFNLLNEKSHAREFGKKMTEVIRKESKENKKTEDDLISEKLNEFFTQTEKIRSLVASENEKRKLGYELSLKFLQDITGINWKTYFVPTTEETNVFLKKVDENGVEYYEKNVYSSYEKMFDIDPSVLNSTENLETLGIASRIKKPGKYVNSSIYYQNQKDGKYYVKRLPSITGTLINTFYSSRNQGGIAGKIKKYFHSTNKGADSKVRSNFQKLSSTLSIENRISLKGTDIKGDKFNSFRLYSHIQKMADNIHESEVNNNLVKFYKKKGAKMELMLINGVKSEINEKESTADKVTEEEYWIAQLILFNKASNGEYTGSLGQFGDKKDIFVTKLKHYVNPNMEQLEKKFDGIKNAKEFLDGIARKAVKYSMLKNMDVNKRRELVNSFIYNYAMNIKDILELLHGTEEDYVDKKTGKFLLADLIKRGSSTISSGYKLDSYVKDGVGKSFRFVSAIDMNYPDELELSKERADGLVLVSGKYMEKILKSMGSVYGKEDLYKLTNGEEGLSSIKALISNIEKGKRGLVKGNWVNIDYLVESYKNHPNLNYYKQLKKFMDNNEVDILSFNSSTKKFYGNEHLDLFDKEGNVKTFKKEDLKGSITDMNTEDIVIQQDLRHEINPAKKKMAVQFFANIMSLNNAENIFAKLNEYTKKELDNIYDKLKGADNYAHKIKLLLEEIDPETQQEIYDLLKSGATLHEAGIANSLQKIISSYVTKKALGLNMMRSVSQELPADKTLKGLRKSKGDEHTLVPQVDIGGKASRLPNHNFEGSPKKAIEFIYDNKEEHADLFDTDGNLDEHYINIRKGVIPGYEGIRYQNDTFKGDVDAAIKFVRENKEKHKDLFDNKGKLKTWELRDYEGSIPGSYITTTRVPADALHSHTVARARYKLNGNFIVLDKESQARSGSDYDGDLRYNSTPFKEHANLGDQEKLANEIYQEIVNGYEDPAHYDKIMMPINTKYFDAIVKKHRSKSDNYLFYDPFGINDLRQKNIVGIHMKGIMTNALTAVSILFSHNYTLKSSYQFAGMQSKTIVSDKSGKIRNAIGILLNLAYDNAKNPRIEILGLNEITSNMYVMSLITDDNYDSIPEDKQDEYILNKADKLAEYLNSPLMVDFIKEKREAGGVNTDIKDKAIFEKLEKTYSKDKIVELKSAYYNAMDLFEIKRYYELTYQTPNTVSDLNMALNLHLKFANNEFKIVNVKNSSKIDVFANVDEIINTLFASVFNHNIDLSLPGQELYDMYLEAKKDTYIKELSASQLKKGIPAYIENMNLTTTEYESINRALNTILVIEAVQRRYIKQGMNVPTFEKLKGNVINKFNEELKKNPENKFLDSLQVENEGQDYSKLRIHESITFSQLTDIDLSEIKEDFDKLSEGFKKDLMLYMFQQYGVGISSFRGSFHKLISTPYRVKVSNWIEEEADNWHSKRISKMKLNKIASWMSKNIPELNEYIPSEMSNLDNKYIYDLAIDPAMNLPTETLTQISEIEGRDVELVKRLLKAEDFSFEDFKNEYFKYRTKAKKGETYKVQDYAKDLIQMGAGYEEKISPLMLRRIEDDFNHCK